MPPQEHPIGKTGRKAAHYFHTGPMDEAALPQAMVKDPLGRPDESLGAVGDDQQRCPQPTGDQPGQEVRPGIMALGTAGGQPDQHRLAVGGDGPGDQDRFGAGAVVHLEVRAVQEQVLQLDVGQATMGPCLELVLDLLADAADGRLRQRRLRPERFGQRCLDIPHRQATHEPRDDQRLQRVGPGHLLAEQPRGERLVGAAQLGAFQHHRPGGGLDRHRGVAVAVPRPGALAAGVAITAKKGDDLCFQRGLQQQTSAEPGDLLQGLAQILVGGEQLVDLGADALGG